MAASYADRSKREIVLVCPHRQYLAPRVRVTVDALLAGFARDQNLNAARETLPPEYCA